MEANEKNKILGEGAYGCVVAKDGIAIKTFKDFDTKKGKKIDNLRYLIQEYAVLQYLSNCNYVIRVIGLDLKRLQIKTELQDDNLRKWIDVNVDKLSTDKEKHRNIIIHDILCGLVEIHDRNLAHGDLKPGNILIKNNPLKAILGDCGFVSIAKYAKVNSTTKSYRDVIVDPNAAHDLFSLGICLFELISGYRIIFKIDLNDIESISRQRAIINNRHYRIVNEKNYESLIELTRKEIINDKYYEIIKSLFNKNKEKRMTARAILNYLYDENPKKWINTHTLDSSVNFGLSDNKYLIIRDIIQVEGYAYNLKRTKIGYGTIITFFNKNNISSKLHIYYAAVTLMILSSLFGKSGFRVKECIQLCERHHIDITVDIINDITTELLTDNNFITGLLSPEIYI